MSLIDDTIPEVVVETYSQKYYKLHREEIKEYNKKYNMLHREEIRKRQLENCEEIKLKKSIYYQKHKKEISEKRRNSENILHIKKEKKIFYETHKIEMADKKLRKRHLLRPEETIILNQQPLDELTNFLI